MLLFIAYFNPECPSHRLTFPISKLLTAEIKNGCRAACRRHAEGDVGLRSVRIKKGVPPNVALAKQSAANLRPVGASVVDGGDSSARLRTDYDKHVSQSHFETCSTVTVRLGLVQLTVRPASLGDVHRLSSCNTLGVTHGGPEVVGGLLDGVGLGRLEVGEGVVAEPVNRGGDAGVLASHPRGPGVDVADGLALERGAADPVSQPADVSLNLGAGGSDAGVGGNAIGAAAVEILGPDADADYAVGEGGAVLLGGAQQGVELVLVDAAAGTGPQAHQDLSIGVDRGLVS